MSLAISAIVVGTALVATQYEQGRKANALQEQAMAQAKADAEKNASLQDQAFNKANAKKPDLAAIFTGNKGAGGIGSTMLTGAQGVDPSALSLSKNTLLGS